MRYRLLAPAALVLLAGCNGAGAAGMPDVLGAQRVGEMAEAQLEQAHPDLAPGTMACANLDFKVGAEVRCVRTAVMSSGRQVRINGTVRVTSVADGGRLHVRLEDHVAEFGASEEYVQDRVADAITRVYAVRPDSVGCPYLSGPVGTSVPCEVRFGEDFLLARPTVVRVDPEEFRTVVGFPDGVLPERINPHLDRWLRQFRADGYGTSRP